MRRSCSVSVTSDTHHQPTMVSTYTVLCLRYHPKQKKGIRNQAVGRSVNVSKEEGIHKANIRHERIVRAREKEEEEAYLILTTCKYWGRKKRNGYWCYNNLLLIIKDISFVVVINPP